MMHYSTNDNGSIAYGCDNDWRPFDQSLWSRPILSKWPFSVSDPKWSMCILHTRSIIFGVIPKSWSDDPQRLEWQWHSLPNTRVRSSRQILWTCPIIDHSLYYCNYCFIEFEITQDLTISWIIKDEFGGWIKRGLTQLASCTCQPFENYHLSSRQSNCHMIT